MDGKNVLITGSTSGLGYGIARTFAAGGYNIMIHGMVGSPSAGAELCKELSALGNDRIRVSFDDADLRVPGQIIRLMNRCDDDLGGVDILVNNAGMQHVASIQDFADEMWNDVIAVNLSSYFRTIKHVLPRMIKNDFGRVINIASTHGLIASAKKSAYVASKHGVVGLTKVVALEVAPYNINCNAICPGFIMTPLVEKQIADLAKAGGKSFEDTKRDFIADKHPNGTFVSIKEVSSAVMLFVSAPSITGTHLAIDGGWTAQ